jgi:hypothetical protein
MITTPRLAAAVLFLAAAVPPARALDAAKGYPQAPSPRRVVPADAVPVRIVGDGDKAIAVYQFRLVFLALPKDVRLGTFGGERRLRLLRDGTPVAPAQLPAAAVMTFKEPIEVTGAKGDAARTVMVCTNPKKSYASTTAREIAVFGPSVRLTNAGGAYGDFCGVVDLDGAVVYRFPPRRGDAEGAGLLGDAALERARRAAAAVKSTDI